VANRFFHLEIVTPSARAYQGEVSLVEVPGLEGQMGIMAGHAPMLALLLSGVLHLRDHRRDMHFAIGAGFIQVEKDEVTVITYFAQRPWEIDLAAAGEEKAEAEKKLAKGLSQEEADPIRLAWLAAQARIKVGALSEEK